MFRLAELGTKFRQDGDHGVGQAADGHADEGGDDMVVPEEAVVEHHVEGDPCRPPTCCDEGTNEQLTNEKISQQRKDKISVKVC